ncbi:AP2/ERF domain-containing protein PFD0985w isoform X2 [Aphidius gifuensis]|uniref:AP2/ERF domain-containing protein PFD0985w isoform X2 n=1 Tax=Aphidius gifuensis TaxID=684658 RepID=UPI001CDC0712|nr:AP2/ERF domain-containing protein PFD0985w isoform X2 [Aphidius gifuensis]
MTEVIMEKAGAMINSCLNIIVQVPLGQTFFRLVDRSLWIIEKSAQWSLPNHEIPSDENGKSFKQMELVRPLPWIFFLPTLVVLRLIRISWNIAASIVGFYKIEPSDIVKFLQKSRRRLRAIKSNAIKTTRHKRSGSLQTATTPEEKTTEPIIQDIQKKKYNQVNDPTDESDDETINKKHDRLTVDNNYDNHNLNTDNVSNAEISADDENEENDCSDGEIDDLQKDVLRNTDNDEISESDLTSFVGYNVNFDNKKVEHRIDGDLTKMMLSMENKEFYSPIKNQEDGDTTFYSPISSQSASPECLSPTTTNVNYHTIDKISIYENGEDQIDVIDIIDSDFLDKSNGHDKINKQNDQTILKPIPKNKRGGFGNRKKK